jgi:TnpA family transposase
VEELALSVCAVLLAEACNVGLESVARPEIEALRRGRLSWVDQNYVRTETIASANARLVDFQAQIPTVAQWGNGQLASVDGLRFRVPVKSIHAGHNPKYFGVGSGVTYLNFVSDQFSGFHGIVVPGTLRDSLFVLDGLIEQNTALHHTGASSDMVFGLFRLLGPWLAKDSALNLPTCTSAATGVWTNTLTMGDSTISPPRGSTRH